MKINGDEEEEEYERLIYKVVEYIHPSMAKELLGKFPDNSAFDFDYTQSSIWSPLVPRPYISTKNTNTNPISFNMSLEITPSPMKKTSCLLGLMNNKFKKNIGKSVSDLTQDLVKKKKKKLKHKDFDFPSSRSTKGWNKVLKAACNHFKKKKKDPMAHIKLPKCLKEGNF